MNFPNPTEAMPEAQARHVAWAMGQVVNFAAIAHAVVNAESAVDGLRLWQETNERLLRIATEALKKDMTGEGEFTWKKCHDKIREYCRLTLDLLGEKP